MNPSDLLAKCLADIAAGRRTLDQCLTAHPELATELRAAKLLQTWSAPKMSPAKVRALNLQMRSAAWGTRPFPPPARPRRQAFPVQQFATAMALVLALVFSSGAGAVAAAGPSLPGQPLYPVKRAQETVQFFFTPPAAQASFHLLLANRRLDEITALAQQGQVSEAAITDLTTATEAALAAIPNTPASQQRNVADLIASAAARQQTVLQTVIAAAPPQAQKGLAQALQASGKHLLNAQGLGSGQAGQPGTPPAASNAETAPGQAVATEMSAGAGNAEVPPGQAIATEMSAGAGNAEVPPGQAKQTETTTFVPPGQAKQTETALFNPPGLDNKTQTPAPPAGPNATPSPAGNDNGGSDNGGNGNGGGNGNPPRPTP